jgi:hypothetical protein
MKTYEVCYTIGETKKGDFENRVKAPTIQMEANNIKEVFYTIRKDIKGADILWINEIVSFWKRPSRFNKFFYVDKKTGELLGHKLIYDMNKKEYINKFPSIQELLSNGELTKARQLFLIKSRPKFNHYRAQVEKFFIRNGLLSPAIAVNNWRISLKVKTEREKAHFDLANHFSKEDLSGQTQGCGCTYCKLHYLTTLYKVEQEEIWDKIVLHKAYHSGRMGFFLPKGDYYATIIPVLPSARQRLVKLFTKANSEYNKFRILKNQCRSALQIPKI